MADNSDSSAPPKRVRGRPFPKGVSGNPGGRPKGFAALVRERTNDNEESAELVLKVMRGELSVVTGDGVVTPTVKERMDAAKWLTSYGAGLPTQTVEHSGEGGGPLVVEIRKYSEDDE